MVEVIEVPGSGFRHGLCLLFVWVLFLISLGEVERLSLGSHTEDVIGLPSKSLTNLFKAAEIAISHLIVAQLPFSFGFSCTQKFFK